MIFLLEFCLPEDNRRLSSDNQTHKSKSWAWVPLRYLGSVLYEDCSVSWCVSRWRDLQFVREAPRTVRRSTPAHTHPSCWRGVELFVPSQYTHSPPIYKKNSKSIIYVDVARDYWKIRSERFVCFVEKNYILQLIKNVFQKILLYL